MVEFEAEEDRDRDGARLAVVRYRPLLDYLFDKYTVKNQLKKYQSELLQEKHIVANDLIKMLRDHNIGHSMINKTEVSAFIKLINRKMICRFEEDALDF